MTDDFDQEDAGDIAPDEGEELLDLEPGEVLLEERDCLDALCQELDRLPEPLRELWLGLDGRQIERLLQAIGSPTEQLLRDFGAPSPRRPNRVSANHLRRSIAAANARRRCYAIGFVTSPVMGSLRDGADTDAVEEWGEDLCRVALTAVALGRHHERHAVPMAVRTMLNLDLLPRSWADHAGGLRTLVNETMEALDRSRAALLPDDGARDGAPDDAPEVAAAIDVASLPAWAQLQLSIFREALKAARDVAGDVLDATEHGCPPPIAADEILLDAYNEAINAAELIRAAGARVGAAVVPEASAGALERAVEEITALVDPTAGAAHRLVGVTGPDGTESVVAVLREVAGSAALRAFASVLVELIDAVDGRASPLRIAELDAAARHAAPDGLAPAIVLATTGHLRIPAGPAAGYKDGASSGLAPSASPAEPIPSSPAHLDPEVGAAVLDDPASTDVTLRSPDPTTETTPEQAAQTATGLSGRTSDGEALTQAAVPPAPAAAAAPPVAVPPRPENRSVPAPEQLVVGVDKEDDDESASACEDLLLAALNRRRFALAWWASVAGADPAPLLRLSALSANVRTSVGPVPNALRDTTLALSRRDYGSFPGVQVLAAVAAVRAALVAPAAGTSSLAVELARMLELPGLSALAEAAAVAASRGVTLAGDTLSGLGDADRLESRIRQHASEAGELLRRDRRLNFQRASEIWKQWISSEGLLGAVLAPVAADARDRAGDVEAAAEALRSRSAIERALKAIDQRLRGSGSKRIEGSARTHLVEGAMAAGELAQRWCTDVALLEKSSRDAGWLDAPTAELRSAATSVEAVVRSELRGAATDPVSEAAAEAAAEVLDEICSLLTGQSPTGGPDRPELILGTDLLAGDTRVDAQLSPAEDLRPEDLAPALERDLAAAFAARADRGDHLASGLIAEVVSINDPVRGEALAVRRADAVRDAAAVVERTLAEAREQLEQARRQLYVSEDRYAELSARVEGAARSGRVDFDAVAEELARVRDEVAECRRSALAAFLAGLEEAATTHPAVAAAQSRIAELAQTDLATASEWLALAIEGRSLTDTTEAPFSLGEIWPSVAEEVDAGISDELVADLAARHDHGTLRFSSLPVEVTERAAAALRKWRRISRGAHRNDWLEELRPILRLLGIDAEGVDAMASRSLPSAGQRHWVELTGVVRPGKALVPTFGSKAGTRLRVLVAFGAPTEATLLEWATPGNSDRPVVVLHVGTLPLDFRLRFGAECRGRRARPEIALIDDAVLAWAAARGEFRFEPMMRAVLPFVATNPYLPPSGDCPPELFYGRSKDRRDLVDTHGSCLLYGGRQLGKSALLRSTVRDFGASAGQVACYIDLKPASIGSTRRADVVWNLLWSRLGEHGVIPAGRGAGRDPAAKVAEAVRSWLSDDDGRRILVALDECDDFFDVDAATNFATTSRLKDLMDHTGRRFKVVWAGLHQVARFANVPNHPLAHLGRPIAIGPLDPSAAHRLIAEPMRALGIDFARPDLVNRVLAYCNYQPVLLHLFGQALVEQMLFPPREPVPVTVGAADVEAVASSPTLQHEIRERFELTLGLDPRYRVIAYTVAHEAHTRGVEVALSVSELRAACERWWPAGFRNLDPAEFRALLEEMAALGVLAASTSRTGWRLRSPNVLRMLGTVAQVEDRLLEEESREPTWLVTTEARRVLPDGRRSPVSEGQLTDLVGEGRNQVRVVIGSEATCVSALADAVRSVAETTGRFRLRNPGKYDTFNRNLVEGTVGEHFVVMSDLRGVSADSFAKSLAAAAARVPLKGGTRSVLLVADASNLEALTPLVDPDGETVAGVEVTPLRRLDLRGLRAWALEVESAFQDDEARERLAEITGGWPVVLEEAAALAQAGNGTSTILGKLAVRMDDPEGEGAAALLRAVGLGTDGPLFGLVDSLASSSGVSLTPEDLAEFVEGHERPAAVVALLRLLGVLEPAAGDDGELCLEPVLCRCWAAVGRLGEV